MPKLKITKNSSLCQKTAPRYPPPRYDQIVEVDVIAFFFGREFMNSDENKQECQNNEQPTEIFDIFDPENGIIPWLDEHGGERQEDHNFEKTRVQDNGLEIAQALKRNKKTDNVEAENAYQKESESRKSDEISDAPGKEEGKLWLKQRAKRMALFQLKSDSSVLEAARLAALKRSRDEMEVANVGYSNRNKDSSADRETVDPPIFPAIQPDVRVVESVFGSCDEVDTKPESGISKHEKYQNRLALNRKSAKRARICRDNYILEMEKQLERLENEIQELKNKKEKLTEIKIEEENVENKKNSQLNFKENQPR